MRTIKTQFKVVLLLAIVETGGLDTQAADPTVDLPCPMSRQCRQMAKNNGRTTVAVEMNVGRYDQSADAPAARRACSALSPAMRYRIPECVVIEEFDARRAGDLDARAALSEPGYNRDKTRSRVTTTAEGLRQILSGFDEIRFAFKASWDDYLSVTYLMYGATERVPWTVELKWVGDRYWLTEEITLNHMIHPVLHPFFSEDQALICKNEAFSHSLRVSCDSRTPADWRATRLEQLENAVSSGSTWMVLYLDVDDGVAAEGADLQSLAEGDPVDRALATAISRYASSDATPQELTQVWDPESRAKVEVDLRRVSDSGIALIESFTLGRHASQLQVVNKIAIDDGTLIYARVPRGMGEIKPAVVVVRQTEGRFQLAHKLPNNALNQLLTDPVLVNFLASPRAATR